MHHGIDRQVVRSAVEVGKSLKLHAEIDVSPKGLLAIGVMLSCILPSTSVLVATAIREGRKTKHRSAV
jgi:hypothetical protein